MVRVFGVVYPRASMPERDSSHSSRQDVPLYLREDILAAFDTSRSYENGRLPSGDGDAIPMVLVDGR